jgi:hypothetical protein
MLYTIYKILSYSASLLYDIIGREKGLIFLSICVILFLSIYSAPSSSPDTGSNVEVVRTDYYSYSEIPSDSVDWSSMPLQKNGYNPNDLMSDGISDIISNYGSMQQIILITTEDTGGRVLSGRSWVEYGGDDRIYNVWTDKDGKVYELWKDGEYKTVVDSEEVYPAPPKPLDRTNETGDKTEQEALMISDPTTVGHGSNFKLAKAMKFNSNLNFFQYQQDDETIIVRYDKNTGETLPVYYRGTDEMNGDKVVLNWVITDIGEAEIPSDRVVEKTTNP